MDSLHHTLNLSAALPRPASSHHAHGPEYSPGPLSLGLLEPGPPLPAEACAPGGFQSQPSFAYSQHPDAGGLPLPCTNGAFSHPDTAEIDPVHLGLGLAVAVQHPSPRLAQPGPSYMGQGNPHPHALPRLAPGLSASGPSDMYVLNGASLRAEPLVQGLALGAAPGLHPGSADYNPPLYPQRMLQYDHTAAQMADGPGPHGPGLPGIRSHQFPVDFQPLLEDAVLRAAHEDTAPLMAMGTSARFHDLQNLKLHNHGMHSQGNLSQKRLLQTMRYKDTYHQDLRNHNLQSPKPSSRRADAFSPTVAPTDRERSRTPISAHQVSPAASVSETQPRKKQRQESHIETERFLLGLAGRIGPLHVEDSALKIKQMDVDAAAMQADPVFGLLCNPKDIKQDRHHQVFALAWLGSACEASPEAVVPRNRIYARYVQMCGHYTVRPLMPAAFGRLVRLQFPNLTLRRLGMRGKSKYHYCGVKLRGDSSHEGSPMSSHSSVVMDSPQSTFHTPLQTESPTVPQLALATPASFVNVQEHFLINDFKYLPNLYLMIEQDLLQEHENNQLAIPSIYAYLPKNFDHDPDIADTLHALMRIQCTAMFELIRYMRKDDLFLLMAPLPAMLTGPICKLLNSEHALEWVKDCDSILYRAMLKMLSRLHLKNVNKDIVAILKDIASGFVGKLAHALGDRVSLAFKTIKLKLARQFIKLVNRLVRCIETGFGASMVLSNAHERCAMLLDWSALNFQDTVLREIPCGMDISQQIIRILERRVPRLLQETPTEGLVLDIYAAFIFDLPAKFPAVNPWLFSLLLSNLLTSFIREMSMIGSRSFKLWWIVGCWVNEYMSWSFELGGYLCEEFSMSHGMNHEGMDIGSSVNESGDTEFNFHEKLISTVDLLEAPY